MSASGIYAYIEYGKQSNYTTPVSVGAATRAFGMDQKVTQISDDENMFTLHDLYNNEVVKYAFGNSTGTLGVEWTLSNPWWIDSVLTKTSTTGTGPYTHTYADDKTVTAYTVEVGFDTTTDRVLQLQQLTANDITVSTAINDVAKVRGNFTWGATPTTAGTTLDASVVTDDITTPYTMVMATLENPSGTPLAEVQSMELTINPNISLVYGPNSSNSVNAYKGVIKLTGKFSATIRDNTWWNNVRARTEPTNNTLRMKFTNGLASTAERTMQFTLTGLGLDKLNMSLDPNELVVEEVPFTARSISVVAVNNTSTPP